jgi:hypothetical protein
MLDDENGKKGDAQSGTGDDNETGGGSAGNENLKAVLDKVAAQEKQIKELRKEAGDRRAQKNEAESKALTLEQRISALSTKFEQTTKELRTQKIVSELTKAGCLDPDLASKAKPDDADLSDWVTSLKKDKPYLFKQETPQKRNNFKPTGGNGKTESFGDLFNSAFRGD